MKSLVSGACSTLLLFDLLAQCCSAVRTRNNIIRIDLRSNKAKDEPRPSFLEKFRIDSRRPAPIRLALLFYHCK